MSAADSRVNEVSRAFVTEARRLLTDEYLPKIERCLEKLSDDEIWWRPNAESNSVGNLLLHVAGNARQWVVSGLGGEADIRVRDAEFDERSPIPRAELLLRLRQTVREVDSVLVDFNDREILAQRKIQGTNVSALQAIFHVTEHFSMHTGQIILLTKMLARKDLGFYDFSTGVPVHSWRKRKS